MAVLASFSGAGAEADLEEARPTGSPTAAAGKQQLYSLSAGGLTPSKVGGGSMFSVRYFLFAIFLLAVMTCSTYQLLVQ
jgi:hypothetical protein